jgi:hypothetical protein
VGPPDTAGRLGRRQFTFGLGALVVKPTSRRSLDLRRALHYQRQVKFVVEQKRREAESRIVDIFGDTLHGQDSSRNHSESDVRSLWLETLPSAGAEVHIDESRIADMAETCGCLISRLQSALRDLIEQGILENIDAERTRPKNVVNYEKGETIRRLK